MYRCSCYKPLTEFDVKFHENLFGKNSGETRQCFACRTKGLKEVFRKTETRKRGIRYALTILIAVASVFLSAFFCVLFIDLFHLYNTVWEIVLTAISAIITYTACGFILVCNGKLIGTFNLERLDKTTYDSRRYVEVKYTGGNTAEVRNVEGSISTTDTSLLLSILLFFTMPIWLLPYLLYATVLLPSICKRACPSSVWEAYKKTKNEVPKIAFSRSVTKTCQKNAKRYHKQVANTRKRYSVLGFEAEQNAVKGLYFPRVQVGDYTILEYYAGYDCYFVLYRDADHITRGAIIHNGYRICSDDDWFEDWRSYGATWEVLTYAKSQIVAKR